MPVSGVNISICALLLTQTNIIYTSECFTKYIDSASTPL